MNSRDSRKIRRPMRAPPRFSPAPPTARQSRSNILVVDDQPANLKLLEELLTQQGHAVRSFPRGRLALDAAARNVPDLILLDINMPEMNGFEVCRAAESRRASWPAFPCCFLSALNETSDKVTAFRSGGVDYITKPFQLEEVRARVETHLELHRARQRERGTVGANAQWRGKGAVGPGSSHVAHPYRAFRCAAEHGGSYGRANASARCLAV